MAIGQNGPPKDPKLFTDQNQTQHNSLRSGETPPGQKLIISRSKGPAGPQTVNITTYKLSVSFLRSIRQTTRSHARRCLLGVATLAKTAATVQQVTLAVFVKSVRQVQIVLYVLKTDPSKG